ncbi:MAG: asparagine synthase (glutamine-hydrolyzing) [Flavobacteriales bacterium]|nr:asparagine synthase (glutamine-hydrolyzing) [Flavobacteriales bacterium]MBK7940895.1 asparagine synthase (glutamine-hydrolyzing) [Flavobacteriales bacterium]MBK8948455.1 asparagine synthase (glutamine-hydrolyzing) [Flavobacteriales bacterium]MBK9701682.1 asparagine synthase (glutamine-hydrolyzing) [Flavobacteriales bacterium]
MCGIAGTYHLGGGPAPSDERIRAALACIAHRGPDDEGVHRAGRAVLGHRRLSIIDTSAAGHQPFTDLEGRYTIVFNGEVFNFAELRARLEAQGHRFKSRTDTEVALRLFALKGPAFLHDLNGFFALAIHDAQEDTLFLARDRFGVKPLLWCLHEDTVMFASELGALLALGAPRRLDRVSLRTYFTHYYIPAPHTILEGVHKLRPGHSLMVDAQGIRTARWYEAEAEAAKTPVPSDPVQRLRDLMDDAVRIRLVSDVPVGTFLSGGLDSSIVSALARRHKPDLRTFSIGYTEAYYDETPFAEAVARHLGTDHTTFTLGHDDLAASYDDLLAALDEPFADQSALPSYVLNARTRQQVTVALSGDGADEVFGGYRKHQAELRVRAPGTVERLALLGSPLWRVLPRSRNHPLADKVRQLDRFARSAALSAEDRYLLLASWDEELDAATLLDPASDEGAFAQRRAAITAPLAAHRDLNGLLWADVHTVLPDDMLRKVDLTSMAHALEVRTPFLDRRVVELAFALPSEVKFRKGSGKQLLREAFGDLLPQGTLTRAKRGFEVPLTPLLKGPLADRLATCADTELLRAAGLEPGAVRQVLNRFHGPSPGSSQATVHALIVYLTWWRRYMA